MAQSKTYEQFSRISTSTVIPCAKCGESSKPFETMATNGREYWHERCAPSTSTEHRTVTKAAEPQADKED